MAAQESVMTRTPTQAHRPLVFTLPRYTASTCGMGLALAIFLLGGRWNLGRLFPESALAQAAEPRVFGVILYAVTLFLGGKLSRSHSRLVWPLTSFAPLLLYLLASFLWSSHSEVSSEKSIETLISLALLVAIILTPNVRVNALQGPLWFSLFSLTLIVALASLPSALAGAERLSSLGGGPNVFARLMGILALSSIFLARRTRRTSFWLVVPLALLLLTLSGSRGGLLAAIATGLYLAFQLGLKPRTFAFLLFGSLVLIPFSLSVNQAPFSPIERYTTTTFTPHGGIYTAGRDQLYLAAIEQFTEHPFMGTGLGEYALRRHTYPHNLFLELLAEGGILALVLFLAPCVSLGLRFRRLKELSLELTALWIFFLLAAQFSGDLFDNRLVFIVGTLALSTSFIQRSPKRKAT